MPGYDYLWNNARGRNQDPIITLTPDCEPLPVAQMVKNPQVWSLGQEAPLEKGMATYSSPLKATYLLPPNSVSVLFIWLRWAEKAKNLASKSVITIGAVIAEPFSKFPYAEMGRKRFQQNWLFFFFSSCLQDVKVIDFKWQIQHMAWLWLESKRIPWKESLELLHKLGVSSLASKIVCTALSFLVL